MADFSRDIAIGTSIDFNEVDHSQREETIETLKSPPPVFRKRKPLHWFDTGTATTFKVFRPNAPYKLLEIRFKTAALAAGEDLTITKTNLQGADPHRSTYHDVILFFEELGDTGTTDLTIPFGPDEGFMTKDDSIVFALSANTGSDRWGLEVVYELV